MKTSDVKKGLVASGLSLLMMLTVMAGTSFAWFNQTIVNQGARIQAGTLQVEFLSNEDGNFSAGATDLATSSVPVFQFGTNAQPGNSQSKYLRVKNLGTISLDYEVMFRVVLDTGLAEAVVITIDKVVPDEAVVTRYGDDIAGYKLEHTGAGMAQNAFETYLVTMTFDQSAGDEFQGKAFSLDMTLIAWQSAQVASKPILVSSLAQLQDAANPGGLINAVKGSTIVLLNDISDPTASVAFTQLINLDLRGKTLNLQSFSVTSTDYGFMRFENGQLTVTNYTINTPNAELTHANNLIVQATNSTLTTSGNSYILLGRLLSTSLTLSGNTALKPQEGSRLVVENEITKAPGSTSTIIPSVGSIVSAPESEDFEVLNPLTATPGAIVGRTRFINPGDNIQTVINQAVTFVDGVGSYNYENIFFEAGEYTGTFLISYPLNLYGPNHYLSGNSQSRQPEAILKPSNSSIYHIGLAVSDVTIAGIKMVRDAIQGLPNASVSGIYVYQATGFPAAANVTIKNNIFDGFYSTYGSIFFGLSLANSSTKPFANALIEDNYLPNGGYIHLQGTQAIVRNNVITGARTGIQIQPYRQPLVGGLVENNTIQAYLTGIWFNYANRDAAPWTIRGNTITATNTQVGDEFKVGSSDKSWEGIAVRTFPHPDTNFGPLAAHLSILNNNINGSVVSGRTSSGFHFRNITSEGTYSISGNTLANLTTGFFFEQVLDGNAWTNFSGQAIFTSTIVPAQTFTNVTNISNAPN